MFFLKTTIYNFRNFAEFRVKKFFTTFLITAILISIHSLAYSFQVTLAWDPNTEDDLAGYRAYYGKTSGIYTYSADVGNYNTATISGLEAGETYYFAVTAYDHDGNESDFSEEISYLVSDQIPDQISFQIIMPWITTLLLDE